MRFGCSNESWAHVWLEDQMTLILSIPAPIQFNPVVLSRLILRKTDYVNINNNNKKNNHDKLHDNNNSSNNKTNNCYC